jgi:DNA ligase (NAD+)
MAEQISGFFADSRNASVLDDLLDGKVDLLQAATGAGGPLAGCRVVFTGGLSAMPRRQAQLMVENLGGKITSAVSKDTTYVVAGTDPGSKYDKAVKLGVKILNEAEFIELMARHGVEV